MEPPFGRVLRNYEGFVVVLRVIGALAIVYTTLSLFNIKEVYNLYKNKTNEKTDNAEMNGNKGRH